MIRRTAFTSVGGFHPAFRQAEDTELIFRLLQVGEFVGVDRCLHGYRRHDTNATSSNLAARSGALRAIKLQQWGAEAGRNQPLAALIGQNLKRYRTAAGHSTGDDMMVALGQGDWESVWKAIGWGATHSPRATIAGALRRTAQWARNGSQRLVGQLGQSRKDSTLSDGEGQPTTQNVREL